MSETIDVDPIKRFAMVFAKAQSTPIEWPNAMVLSTVGVDGRPSSRMVLLKGFDSRGFCFYTNLSSRKAKELCRLPFGALLFYWPTIDEQIRIEGSVLPVTDA